MAEEARPPDESDSPQFPWEQPVTAEGDPWMDPEFRPTQGGHVSPDMEEILQTRRNRMTELMITYKPPAGMPEVKATIDRMNKERAAATPPLPPLWNHAQGDGGNLKTDSGERVDMSALVEMERTWEDRLRSERGGNYSGNNFEDRLLKGIARYHLIEGTGGAAFAVDDGGRDLLVELHAAIVRNTVAQEIGEIRAGSVSEEHVQRKLQSAEVAARLAVVKPALDWVGDEVVSLKQSGPMEQLPVAYAHLDPKAGIPLADDYRRVVGQLKAAGMRPAYFKCSLPGNPGGLATHDHLIEIAKMAYEGGAEDGANAKPIPLILDIIYNTNVDGPPTINVAALKQDLPPEVFGNIIIVDGSTKGGGDSADKTCFGFSQGGRGAEILKALRANHLSLAGGRVNKALTARTLAWLDNRMDGFSATQHLRELMAQRRDEMVEALGYVEKSHHDKGHAYGWTTSGRSFYPFGQKPMGLRDADYAELCQTTEIGAADGPAFGPGWEEFVRPSWSNPQATVKAMRNYGDVLIALNKPLANLKKSLYTRRNARL